MALGQVGAKVPEPGHAATSGQATGGEAGPDEEASEPPAIANYAAPLQMHQNWHNNNPWAILGSPPSFTSPGLLNAQGTQMLTHLAPVQFTGHLYLQKY